MRVLCSSDCSAICDAGATTQCNLQQRDHWLDLLHTVHTVAWQQSSGKAAVGPCKSNGRHAAALLLPQCSNHKCHLEQALSYMYTHDMSVTTSIRPSQELPEVEPWMPAAATGKGLAADACLQDTSPHETAWQCTRLCSDNCASAVTEHTQAAPLTEQLHQRLSNPPGCPLPHGPRTPAHKHH
jgi:hypothetical protein